MRSATLDEHDVQGRLMVLADELRASGDLRSDVWRDVFTRTRRHTFVPRFYVKDDSRDWRAPWRVVNGARPDDRAEWLDGVYSNQTLITELNNQPVPEELGGGTAQTIMSSSTLPGLMVSMLETLDVLDGQQVLEIGTGTGYNAALLSGRNGFSWASLAGNASDSPSLPTVTGYGLTHRTASTTGRWPSRPVLRSLPR